MTIPSLYMLCNGRIEEREISPEESRVRIRLSTGNSLWRRTAWRIDWHRCISTLDDEELHQQWWTSSDTKWGGICLPFTSHPSMDSSSTVNWNKRASSSSSSYASQRGQILHPMNTEFHGRIVTIQRENWIGWAEIAPNRGVLLEGSKEDRVIHSIL